MFWGMNLKPNRKYSQTTAKSFHISQAALDPEVADDTVNKIYISGEDNQKFLICTLRKNICEQVQLDLNFAEGDPICFQTIGGGNVTLSGYLVESSFFGGGDDDEGSEEEEDSSMVEKVKALLNGAGEPGKKKKDKKAKAGKAEDEDEEDSDDDDEDAALNAALESDDEDDEGMEQDDSDDDEEEDDEEDDDEEDDDDEDDDEEEEVAEPKKKVAKIESNKQQQQQNGEQQKSKKEKKAEKQQQSQQQQQQKQPQQKQQQQQQQKTGEERTLTGGVKVVDLRVGNGEEAKQGKRAHVYYEGRLKTNNKVFDSLKNGAPFKFKIGQGEVIKAWDIGVAGMKIGGKRRIICPPHMAYGSRGSPPAIPPNSTLVFEVELKSVSK